VRGFFAKLGALTSSMGWLNGILYLADRVLDTLSGGRARLFKYYFVRQAVHPRPLLPAHRGRKISVHELSSDDARLSQLPRPREVVQARFEQGGRCLAGFMDDVFVGCIWVNPGKYREDEVRCDFIPCPVGEAGWDYDVHVEPKYRLGFAFLRLWDETNALLREQGICWSISRISAFKPESIKSHSRMGASKIGSAVYLAIGSVQLMFSTTAPFVHLSFSDKQRPVLKLGATRGAC